MGNQVQHDGHGISVLPSNLLSKTPKLNQLPRSFNTTSNPLESCFLSLATRGCNWPLTVSETPGTDDSSKLKIKNKKSFQYTQNWFKKLYPSRSWRHFPSKSSYLKYFASFSWMLGMVRAIVFNNDVILLQCLTDVRTKISSYPNESLMTFRSATELFETYESR